MSQAQSFPLCWPVGYPRTLERSRARFDATHDRAVAALYHEKSIEQ
jgi:hypothetical protein